MVVPGVYSQRDPRWGSQLLGLNTDPAFNIYHYGCLVTSLANLGWYTGHNVTPDLINNELKGRGGFVNGGDVVWSVVPAVLPELETHGVVGSLSQANQFVEPDGNFAILQVTKPGFPMHFVVLVDPGRIADPWDGGVKPATSYAFVTAHLYSTKTVPQAPPAPQPEGENVLLTTDQVKDFYHIILGREPENDSQLQNRHALDFVYGAKGERDQQIQHTQALESQLAQVTQERDQAHELLTEVNNKLAAEQSTVSQLAAHPDQTPSEPVNTTHEATPVPVVQKEAVTIPVKEETPASDGAVSVVQDTEGELQIVSTFTTQPKIKLDHGAVITDLNSGLDIQRVPLDTIIPINRVVKLGNLQYVQTDRLKTLNHGISEQYLQIVTPLTHVPVPTAEEVGGFWHKVLKVVHKFHQ